MKEILKDYLKQLISSRYLFALLIALVLLTIVTSIIISLSITPSELQLVSRYTGFSSTHFYTEQWFYLISFVLFGLIVAILNSIIAIKLLIIKGVSIAIMFAWISIGMILFALSTAIHILNILK